MVQEKICSQLDEALLTDEEFRHYVSRWSLIPDPPHAKLEPLNQQDAANGQ